MYHSWNFDYLDSDGNRKYYGSIMATNNSVNYSLGTTGQVLTMVNSTTAAFANASNRSQASVARSLNSIFQVSSTRDSLVNYSVDISTSATLLGGQTGTVYLEISLSSTFASGIQEVARFANGNSVALAVAITVSQLVTAVITGYVPSGYYVRLRSENTVGAPSFTFRSGQEVLL